VGQADVALLSASHRPAGHPPNRLTRRSQAALRWKAPRPWRALVAVALAAWLPALPAVALDERGEYEVKAAFLFHFAKFVEWPQSAFEGPDAPIVVAIAGEDPFQGALERTVMGKTVRGRGFVVERFRSPDEAGHCHILFVPSIEADRQARWIESAAGLAAPLTVGETDSFTGDGGMIAFTIEDRRVRFAIATGAAESAGLRISSRLLALARPASGTGPAGTKP